MGDRRFTDFGAKSGNPSLTDLILLSDASNNYAYLTLQRLRTWIREEVTRSDKGTCSTAAATSAKTATLTDYKQADGKTVLLTFENAVGSGATLSINSNTAKPIFHHGAAIGDGVIGAGDTALLVYDTSADSGSGAYELITVDRAGSAKPDGGWLESDLAAAVQAKLNLAGGIAANTEAYSTTTRSVNIDGYVLEAGALVTVRFSNKLKANTKLRVSPDGGSTYTTAKTIYYGTAAIGEDVVQAGMTVTFRYDGSYYRIIAMTPGYIAPGSITADMLASGVVPGLHYYASTAAYNQDAANVPEGDYILLLDSGTMSLYRRTSSSRMLICTWPSGAGEAKTKIYGFISATAYQNFLTSYPDALAEDDYVLIRSGNEVGATHTLYRYVSAASTSTPPYLEYVYAINDWYVVTATNSNGITFNKTFAQITAAYAAGQQPVLQTEFGQRVQVLSADNSKIRFGGIVSVDSGFWIVDYTIDSSNVVTGKAVACDFLPIFVTKSGNNWDVTQMPSSLQSVADIISAVQNGAKVCVVVASETSNEYFVHPFTRFYGSAAATFCGPEIVNQVIGSNNVHLLTTVSYTIDSGSHVTREVFRGLDVSLLDPVTSGMTQVVGYDPTTGKLKTAPGSGGSGVSWASAPTAQQAGYILVANNDGTASWTDVQSWAIGGSY